MVSEISLATDTHAGTHTRTHTDLTWLHVNLFISHKEFENKKAASVADIQTPTADNFLFLNLLLKERKTRWTSHINDCKVKVKISKKKKKGLPL